MSCKRARTDNGLHKVRCVSRIVVGALSFGQRLRVIYDTALNTERDFGWFVVVRRLTSRLVRASALFQVLTRRVSQVPC